MPGGLGPDLRIVRELGQVTYLVDACMLRLIGTLEVSDAQKAVSRVGIDQEYAYLYRKWVVRRFRPKSARPSKPGVVEWWVGKGALLLRWQATVEGVWDDGRLQVRPDRAEMRWDPGVAMRLLSSDVLWRKKKREDGTDHAKWWIGSGGTMRKMGPGGVDWYLREVPAGREAPDG